MSSRQFSMSSSSVAFLILAVCVAAIYLGGNALKQYMLQRPDLQVLQRDPQVQITTSKLATIHVIREKTDIPQIAAESTATSKPLPNNLFGLGIFDSQSAARSKSKETDVVDYFEQLRTGNYLQINAITHNGAIINGSFVQTGFPIEHLAYPAPGESSTDPQRLVTPKLASANDKAVVIVETVSPYRSITIKAE